MVCASEAQTIAAKRQNPEAYTQKTQRVAGQEVSPMRLGKRLGDFPEDSSGLEIKSKWPSGISPENILLHYEFDRIVGQGYTGKVRLASFKDDQSMSFAVKSISKLQGDDKEGKYFHAEANVLKELDHPNIIQLFECFQDQKNYHLVLEICEGNDLVKLVEKKKGLPESLIKKFFYQAVSAVNYLQNIGVCHRDIKLDNFLLSDQDENVANLKLIDFGFTAVYRGKQLTSLVGTPWYVAPEILDKSKPYTYMCDNWSLGIVLYMMIFARPPFMGRNHAELYSQIANKQIDFSEPQFQKVPQELLKLLKGLLNKDPSKRMSLPQVLQSPWFTSHKAQGQLIWCAAEADHIVQKLRDKQPMPKFEQLFTQQMVKLFSDSEEVVEASRYFFCCDAQARGIIDKSDIEAIGLASNKALSPQEVDEISTNWAESWAQHNDHSPHIKYSQFLAGIVQKKFFANPDRLKMTFDRFDIDKSGRITTSTLVRYFRRIGYTISEETAREMISQFLGSEGCEISFEMLFAHFQQSDGNNSSHENSFYKNYLDSSGST